MSAISWSIIVGVVIVLLVGAIAKVANELSAAKRHVRELLEAQRNEFQAKVREIYENCGQEQRDVAFYFAGLESPLNDEKYNELVQSKLNSLDFYQRALDSCGLDRSSVQETTPLAFSGFAFDDDKVWVKKTTDGSYVSSKYQVAYIFVSDELVYCYRANFELDKGGSIPQEETTRTFIRKDVEESSDIFRWEFDKCGASTLDLLNLMILFGIVGSVSSYRKTFSVPSGEKFVISYDNSSAVLEFDTEWHATKMRRDFEIIKRKHASKLKSGT